MAQKPTENIENIIFGCIDPLANNFGVVQNPNDINPPTLKVSMVPTVDGKYTAQIYNDPQATYLTYTVYGSPRWPCTYNEEVVGCMDRLAVNYMSNATKSCNKCCIYKGRILEELPFNPIVDEPIPLPTDTPFNPIVGEPIPLPTNTPTTNNCTISQNDTQVVSSYDIYNNPIQTVITLNGQPLDQFCCNEIAAKSKNLQWSFEDGKCYTKPLNTCLPVSFDFNNKPLEIPNCGNDLEISMWVYFGEPKNGCEPYNRSKLANTPTSVNNIPTPGTNITSFLLFDLEDYSPTTPPCCYTNQKPIRANISLVDSNLSTNLTQVKRYVSTADGFDEWIELKATIPAGIDLTLGIKLEITDGLNCGCDCDYDIFIDSIEVTCASQLLRTVVNDIDCPGFKLNRVIDNKKSWVYNPGQPDVGISDYDNIERADGDFGMLNGEGIVNRTFAPSLDADIPWRYTDYFEQSSVYERHSSLVLNTKELGLTFDMCANCLFSATTLGCPNGYTLSANTSVCYRAIDCVNDNIITNSTFDYSLSGWTMSPLIDSWIWFSATTAATYNQADSGGTISQNVLTDGQTYNVNFDLVNTDGSQVYVYAGLNSYGPFTASTNVNINVLCSGATNFSIYTISDCGQKLFQDGSPFQFMDGENYIFQ